MSSTLSVKCGAGILQILIYLLQTHNSSHAVLTDSTPNCLWRAWAAILKGILHKTPTSPFIPSDSLSSACAVNVMVRQTQKGGLQSHSIRNLLCFNVFPSGQIFSLWVKRERKMAETLSSAKMDCRNFHHFATFLIKEKWVIFISWSHSVMWEAPKVEKYSLSPLQPWIAFIFNASDSWIEESSAIQLLIAAISDARVCILQLLCQAAMLKVDYFKSGISGHLLLMGSGAHAVCI